MTQIIDLAAFGAAKATTRKELAILAYDGGKAEPAGANWEAVADMLRACFPAVRAVRMTADDKAPAWWRDYRTASRKSDRAVVEVRFADGRVQRASALSLAGKGFNIGGALRLAVAWYRVKCRDEHAPVPEFESVAVLETGETFDPAACNRMTAELRDPVVVAAPVVDVESRVAKVRAELERRKESRSREAARFAAEIADTAAPVTQFRDGSQREYTAEEWKSYLARRAAVVDSEFGAAIEAGERELARLTGEPAPMVESEAEIEAAEAIGEAMLADEIAAECEAEAPAVVAADFHKGQRVRYSGKAGTGRMATVKRPVKSRNVVTIEFDDERDWYDAFPGNLVPVALAPVAAPPAPVVSAPPRMRVPLHLLASASAVAYRAAA
jgi:hypothetical protein